MTCWIELLGNKRLRKARGLTAQFRLNQEREREGQDMRKWLFLAASLGISLSGCSTGPNASPGAGQATCTEAPRKGEATAVVKNDLAAASKLDARTAKSFLSGSCDQDIVAEFKAKADSGWRFSPADTEIVSETVNSMPLEF